MSKEKQAVIFPDPARESVYVNGVELISSIVIKEVLKEMKDSLDKMVGGTWREVDGELLIKRTAEKLNINLEDYE